MPRPVPFGARQSAATIDEMGPRVLIVEDDLRSPSLAAHSLRGVRRGGGHDRDRPGCLRARRPDVVLLDVMLPDGDGRDFCRDLRGARTCRS